MNKKIKVFVVDDSAVVRQVLSGALNKDPHIQVIGVAPDPIVAMERMSQEWPDVIVLDVEMPRMDGITFLKNIMEQHPTPVVICSTLTTKGAETTTQALAAGAFSIVTKARIGIKDFLLDASTDLIQTVKAAALAKVKNLKPVGEAMTPPKFSADVMLPAASRVATKTTERIVAIGASAGGTHAVAHVLTHLPSVCPGIVIVQHMPEKFTASLAARLNNLCEIEVKEASNGDRVMPGRALIAPGAQHLLLRRNGSQYVVEVMNGPLVNRHRPSVDVLFRSVATHAGKNAMGIIMTGMGNDGAAGLLEMRNSGAYTLAQDEETCVVYGMPKAACKLGAVDKSIGLQDIPGEIMRLV